MRREVKRKFLKEKIERIYKVGFIGRKHLIYRDIEMNRICKAQRGEK